MVVLKRLADALRDGDRVLAVVRGSAVNQDGRSNGLTAPNALAQRDVITDALRAGEVAPDTVNYVEAHGTGTVLGDPIEFEALAATYGHGQSPCALGAVKTNLGHLEAAAGVAGFIKAVLVVGHETIPPNLHFTRWNPAIDPSSTRFYVPTENTPWPADGGIATGGGVVLRSGRDECACGAGAGAGSGADGVGTARRSPLWWYRARHRSACRLGLPHWRIGWRVQGHRRRCPTWHTRCAITGPCMRRSARSPPSTARRLSPVCGRWPRAGPLKVWCSRTKARVGVARCSSIPARVPSGPGWVVN